MWYYMHISRTYLGWLFLVLCGKGMLQFQHFVYSNRYGNDIIDPTGPIPAHLMGNMWAQVWANLAPIIKPYPNKQSIDVTQAMKDQGWTPKIMFQKADDFFISLGLDAMPEVKKSLVEFVAPLI